MAIMCGFMDSKDSENRCLCKNSKARQKLNINGDMYCPYMTLCRRTGKFRPTDNILRSCKFYTPRLGGNG